jgi:hypothetical protein
MPKDSNLHSRSHADPKSHRNKVSYKQIAVKSWCSEYSKWRMKQGVQLARISTTPPLTSNGKRISCSVSQRSTWHEKWNRMSYYENYMIFNIIQLYHDLVLHSFVACCFARISNSVHASGSSTVLGYLPYFIRRDIVSVSLSRLTSEWTDRPLRKPEPTSRLHMLLHIWTL